MKPVAIPKPTRPRVEFPEVVVTPTALGPPIGPANELELALAPLFTCQYWYSAAMRKKAVPGKHCKA